MLDAFSQVWAADFEFVAAPGERPEVVCLVARELKTGRTVRLWRDQLGPAPPYPTGPDCLFVAYYASAELGCHLALGWPMPARILDLYAEFRNQTNGLPTIAGRGLIGALAAYGLDSVGAVEKTEMREIVMRGGPWTDDERIAVLDYCESDVDALARLLPAMLPKIDLPRALLRGRYMAAAARMEHAGVPIDMEMLALLRAHWTDIQDALIARIDADYGVFEGRTFKAARFADYLTRANIPWPRLESGHLDLSDDAFRESARSHPEVALRELRSALSELRLNSRSEQTAAIVLYCQHSRRERAAISRAIPDLYSGRVCGLSHRWTGSTTMWRRCAHAWPKRHGRCWAVSNSAPTLRSCAIRIDTRISAARGCGTKLLRLLSK